MSVIDDSRILLRTTSCFPTRKGIAVKIESNTRLDERSYMALNQCFTDAETLSAVRHRTLLQAVINAGATTCERIDSLQRSLLLDRRLNRLEALVPPSS